MTVFLFSRTKVGTPDCLREIDLIGLGQQSQSVRKTTDVFLRRTSGSQLLLRRRFQLVALKAFSAALDSLWRSYSGILLPCFLDIMPLKQDCEFVLHFL